MKTFYESICAGRSHIGFVVVPYVGSVKPRTRQDVERELFEYERTRRRLAAYRAKREEAARREEHRKAELARNVELQNELLRYQIARERRAEENRVYWDKYCGDL